MDGHVSHVMIKTLEQTIEFRLDMVTLPFHNSHMLQPLDVTCFKPFKTTFTKKRNVIMEKNNFSHLDKIILAKNGWAKLCNNLWEKKNIKFGFRVFKIWPLNSVAMATKFIPSEVFTTIEEEDLGNSNHLDTTMQTNNSEDETKAPTKLLNIARTFKE
jgi:hypothetical protein